jgi:hypothetical protein
MSAGLSPLVAQHDLPLARAPKQVAVPIEMVHSKRTSGAAFTLACDSSGLEDKEIHLALGIDAGYFSNIKHCKATLQADLIAKFCTIVGNTIYPEWIAYQVGCTLVMIKSEAERRADAEKARADALDTENKLLRALFTAKAAA